MRLHHLLAASALALLANASWGQTDPVLDPTGSLRSGNVAQPSTTASSPSPAGAR